MHALRAALGLCLLAAACATPTAPPPSEATPLASAPLPASPALATSAPAPAPAAASPFVQVAAGQLQLAASREGDVLVLDDERRTVQRARTAKLEPFATLKEPKVADRGPWRLGTVHRLGHALAVDLSAGDHSGVRTTTLTWTLDAKGVPHPFGKSGARLWGYYPWNDGLLVLRSAVAAGPRVTGNAMDESTFSRLVGTTPRGTAPRIPARTVVLDFVVMAPARVLGLGYAMAGPLEPEPTQLLQWNADGVLQSSIPLPEAADRANTMVLAADGRGAWLYEAGDERAVEAEPTLFYFDGARVVSMQSTLRGALKQVLVAPGGATWLLLGTGDATQSRGRLARVTLEGTTLRATEIALPAGHVVSALAAGPDAELWLVTTTPSDPMQGTRVWYARVP